ncbi:hypothetical protein MNBD_DELTA04-1720 [hydrothermal vent metagenome]|uniref:Cyclic nucleotide-binding domain-containing protein n=1 Tax=hydrothermal vent metagenome TaxID=652676 RepID=A0A3B0VKI1_9ZZZZ
MNSPGNTEHMASPGRGSLEENMAFLRRQPVFADIPLEMLRLYAYLSQREHFQKDEPIIRQGEPGDRMYLIMTGTVAVCEEHNGREFLLQTLAADGINSFGELALLAEFDWFYSARAVTDVTLLSMTREAFRKVMEQYSEQYSEAVADIIRWRIRRLIDQTHTLLDKPAAEK